MAESHLALEQNLLGRGEGLHPWSIVPAGIHLAEISAEGGTIHREGVQTGSSTIWNVAEGYSK